MKVYSLPKEVPAPTVDYRKYDHEKVAADEEQHKAQLKKWLQDQGYTGKHTGRVVSFGVADGSAQYMIADGPKSFLIHLPYCDAYQYPDVRFLPKKEIIRRADANDSFHALFSKKEA